jgi:hypothetical protein
MTDATPGQVLARPSSSVTAPSPSSGWNGVVERLQAAGIPVRAVSKPFHRTPAKGGPATLTDRGRDVEAP